MEAVIDMKDSLEVSVPFQGFNSTIHEDCISGKVAAFHDLDDIFDMQDVVYAAIDWHKVKREYAKQYLEEFEYRLYVGYDIKISLEFASIVSPREYNFTNDRLYATISKEDIMTLRDNVDVSALDRLIRQTFTSRSGFISFYPNRLFEWGEDVLTWDANQLGTLLEAFVQSDELYVDFELITEDFNNKPVGL
jgi:hypothetical protein